MGLVQERVQAWKWLMSQVAKVQDPILRNTMVAEFKQRTLCDWGYCPADGMTSEAKPATLGPWETDLAADIKANREFGIDTRKAKREHEIKEARARIRMFIERGGSLSDIPDDIRTPYIAQMYLDEFNNVITQTKEQLNEIAG